MGLDDGDLAHVAGWPVPAEDGPLAHPLTVGRRLDLADGVAWGSGLALTWRAGAFRIEPDRVRGEGAAAEVERWYARLAALMPLARRPAFSFQWPLFDETAAPPPEGGDPASALAFAQDAMLAWGYAVHEDAGVDWTPGASCMFDVASGSVSCRDGRAAAIDRRAWLRPLRDRFLELAGPWMARVEDLTVVARLRDASAVERLELRRRADAVDPWLRTELRRQLRVG